MQYIGAHYASKISVKELAKNSGNVSSYQYDSSGIRTSKTVNGITTTYTLDKNNNVASQTDGTNILNFIYDTTGKLCYMTLNDVKYYYETNVQGDIIGLLDSSDHEVVTYQYDAWGKLINMDESLASTVGIQNPFRYRGYYYDTETGLYYLQSRYYNPEISRFISRDDASLHKGQTGVSANLYAYANNNPVIYGDPDGHSVTSMILNMASSVLSLVCLVNPVTGGPRFAAALALGLGSLGVTVYDYNQSINHLTEQLRTHKIKQQTYNANIKICNLWYKVGVGAAAVTTVCTFLGANKFAVLNSKLGFEIINDLASIFLGHSLSIAMWINDMVTLMNGDFSWF